MGDNLDNRALPGVKIDVIMGRHAGFLTAASALARVYPDDGPHLIYLPERPFSMTRFVKDVKAVVQAGSGAAWSPSPKASPTTRADAIASKFIKEVDSHGNVQLSGTGALGDLLAARDQGAHEDLARARRHVRLPAALVPRASSPKSMRAKRAQVGAAAVQGCLTATWTDRSRSGASRASVQGLLRARAAARAWRATRAHAGRFINKAGNDVTQAFLDYAAPDRRHAAADRAIQGCRRTQDVGTVRRRPAAGERTHDTSRPAARSGRAR